MRPGRGPADELLGGYLASLAPPDLHTGSGLVLAAMDAEMSTTSAIEEVLVPAQVEIGRRWYAHAITVADEHAATAITDAVLAALSLRVPRRASTMGQVVSCCVEGEWHGLALRMLEVGLTSHGYDVIGLGPSVPPSSLADFLRDHRPLALLAACTIPTNLVGARRTVDAAHAAGVPVILGGRALGHDRRRAEHLGADGWAEDAAGAAAILEGWHHATPSLATPAPAATEHAELAKVGPDMIDAFLAGLVRRQPHLASMSPAQVESTRRDLAYIVDYAGAAVAVDDPTVLEEFSVWLRDLLAPLGVPAAVLVDSYAAVAEVLHDRCPTTAAMLSRCQATLGASAGAVPTVG